MAAPSAGTVEPTGVPASRPARTKRNWRAWLLRLALAAASGFVFYLSFAPRDLWWLAPLAFAGFGFVLRGRRLWGGLGYGFVFGLGLYLPLLFWLQDFLGRSFGSAPWLALSAALAAYLGLAAALCTVVARLPGAPVWMAMVIIASETPRTWWPGGGFPWGRVAFSQPEGAFTPLASVGGAPLLGFAVVVTGFGLTALLVHAGRRDWRAVRLPVVAAVVPVVAGLALWPTIGTGAQAGTRTVAAVQGNAPDVGLDLMYESATLRANHLAQSEVLAGQIRSGAVPRPDLIVWPETATDLTTTDPVLDQVVRDLGVPTLIGARYREPGSTTQNTEFVWDPATGRGQSYSKQQLVPFAEFVPMRAIARWFTPFLDDTGDMRPGSAPAVLDIAGTRVAVPICYEIAYDYVSRDAVNDGAQLIVLPTNNAWYGHSEMTYQQLAMARLRAVEHGRAVVVSSTSGVSALIEPDGTVTVSTSQFTAESLVGSVPLRTQTTLSDRLGAWTEYGLVGAALVAVLAGLVLRSRNRGASTTATRAE
ncbi:apolipoprotein N-acyltransferase [Amycolatopsis endophytica]|uniref:Apolipoprotein N-acyltransferase n=1 Tax=Amycolatopsis endophytica TaxID=860233 RepID=A0A853BA60_9PSEU|nr:apolipoprotein N-acyltransferase [Amycolatopsis endophytica]NYI92049.1 apolipoprotein N-acyltransferase [Amycolatopsis endophytica]